MPEFRVLMQRTQLIGGDLHRHAHLLVKRGDDWSVCGVLVFHSSEWAAFLLICEAVSIEVDGGTASRSATRSSQDSAVEDAPYEENLEP